MKKYIAPEVEIKKFNVENIMAESGTGSTPNGYFTDNEDVSLNNVGTITYDSLFNLN